MIKPVKIFQALHVKSEITRETIDFFLTKPEADEAVVGKGWYADRGEVRECWAIVDGEFAYIIQNFNGSWAPPVQLNRTKLIESARAKLTAAEWEAVRAR